MMRVVIVGVGALGSHVVQFIRSLPIQLRVIDFDRVEQKNVGSQFHGKPSVGKSKVLSLQQTMSFLFSVKVDTIPHKLTELNADSILADQGLIVDCLDNGISRRILQNWVREHSVPCIHGALAAGEDYGRVVWDELFVVDDEPGVGTPTCEDGNHLPFIGYVSSLLAMSIQQFILDGRKMSFQAFSSGSTRI